MITSQNPKVRKGMDLVDDMTSEELDELVDYIRVVFKAKRQTDAARAFATLRVGDKVRYNNNVKPQYLRGLTAEVIQKRDSRVVIKLDRGPVGKFRTGQVIAHPVSLEVIS